MLHKFKLILTLLFWSGAAFAQGSGGSVLPQGVITPGNCTKFGTSKYFVADAGSPCGAGAGSVTSVGLALPTSVFTISGSPVITAGTLTGSFNTQSANTFFAGPSSGVAAVPTFRTLVSADISGSALTRINDTNVTLTLGGAPTVALLSPASLTLGWSGQLGLSRGGTNSDLSATGGTSRVLKQVSVGAAVTVAQLACSDLSSVGTGCSSAAGITALTGDVTATGPGSVAATLATVNSNVGTFGSASQVGVFQVNGKGLIISASNVSFTVPIAANPTATISTSAVNGSATTFMRSDAAPIFDTSLPYAFSGLGKTAINQQAANNNALVISGGSITGSSTVSPGINIAGTINSSGAVAGAVLLANITDTSGTAGTSFVRVQRNGTTLWDFNNYQSGGTPIPVASLTIGDASIGNMVFSAGLISGAVSSRFMEWVFRSGSTTKTRIVADTAGSASLSFETSGGGFYFVPAAVGGSGLTFISAAGNVQMVSGAKLGFTSSSTAADGSPDTILGRGGAAATLQLGAANAASPVAQTLQAQGSRAGTDSNVAGASITIHPGAGTGNITQSNLIFQTYAPVASGSGVQTATTALTLDYLQNANFAGMIVPANIFTPTCGSGCSSITGNDQKFVVTTGIAQTSITVNFGHTWTATPICVVSSNSTASVVDISSRSTTALTFGASVALTGSELYVHCL